MTTIYCSLSTPISLIYRHIEGRGILRTNLHPSPKDGRSKYEGLGDTVRVGIRRLPSTSPLRFPPSNLPRSVPSLRGTCLLCHTFFANLLLVLLRDLRFTAPRRTADGSGSG